MKNESHNKIQNIKKALIENSIDFLILTPGQNLFYIANLEFIQDERIWAFVISAKGEAFVLANKIYEQETNKIGSEFKKIWWHDRENPYNYIEQEICNTTAKIPIIGVDANIRGGALLRLQEVLCNAKFVDANNIFSTMRVIKQNSELENIKQCCQKTQHALHTVLQDGKNWIGRREGDFARALMAQLQKNEIKNAGGLICAGANAAIPHYTGNSGIIQNNSALLVDFGGTYKGYWSDMTRTIVFGNPCERFMNAYNAVETAKTKAVEIVKPNISCEKVDKAARDVIENAGFGEYFTHRTGHGTGVSVHEEPYLVKGNKNLLCENMVFTIEPGIYIPDEFGIRIENQVVVTKNGAQELQDYTCRTFI